MIMESDRNSRESVIATVELSGGYEKIAGILGQEREEYPRMSNIADDMGAVMDIVTRTGGATKSQLAADLPSGNARELDAESVIHVLRVLELYGLVRLDGNTWRPGPALSSGQDGADD